MEDVLRRDDSLQLKILASSLNRTELEKALLRSAKLGALNCVTELLNMGVDKDCEDDSRLTPVLHACGAGHLDVVRKLVTSGCRLSNPFRVVEIPNRPDGIAGADEFGHTPLMCAAEMGSIELMQRFLAQGAKVNMANQSGKTALHYAAKRGFTLCSKLLIYNGANVNAQDLRRYTPLMMACLHGHHRVAEALIHARCDVNIPSYTRQTALHYAAEKDSDTCCEIVLRGGAYLDCRDCDCHSPAMVAASFGSVKALNVLLNHGADMTAISRHGMSILHLAAEAGSISCCDLLISRGMDINIRKVDGVSPLVTAIVASSLHCAHYLIAMGCSPKNRPGDMTSPLGAAVHGNLDTGLVLKLLQHGADINMPDRFHTLPLWRAVHNLNFGVIKTLLQANSAIDSQTESMLYTCVPCCPVIHTLHKCEPTLVRWMLAAYGHEAFSVLRAAFTDRTLYLRRFEPEMLKLVDSLTSAPQPLLQLSRRAVRKQLGCGYPVFQKIESLGLPALLHKYMMFSDLEIPGQLPGSQGLRTDVYQRVQ